MSPKKQSKVPRRDYSAFSKLVRDFGLLMLDADFTRYLENQTLEKQAWREGTLANHKSLEELHTERFVPLLPLLGIDNTDRALVDGSFEIIERLDTVENFINVLTRTTDYSLEIAALHKRLKRKFNGTNALRLSYKTDRLISEDIVRHCRHIMWIVEEFHVPDETDEDDVLWDVNLWTVLIDADRLHRETGMVHWAFYKYLQSYQAQRGDGSPRVYRRAALAILLAECFEDFSKQGRKAQIHDKSKDANYLGGRVVERREAFYDSSFAVFLIKFCEIIDFDEVPKQKSNTLDKYRQILRKRASKQVSRITPFLNDRLRSRQVSEIMYILDCVKA